MRPLHLFHDREHATAFFAAILMFTLGAVAEFPLMMIVGNAAVFLAATLSNYKIMRDAASLVR